MSELSRPGQGGGETGSSGAPNDLIAATMQAIASPRIAPDHEAPREDPRQLPTAELADPPAELGQELLDPPQAELPMTELADRPAELGEEFLDPRQAELKAALLDELPEAVPPTEPPRMELTGTAPHKMDVPGAELPKMEQPAVDDRVTADRLNVDLPKAQMPRAEPFRVETFKAETGAGKAETGARPKDNRASPRPSESGDTEVPRVAREHLVRTPRERGWARRTVGPPMQKAANRGAGKGRTGAMAAMLLLGVAAGAAGGALASLGLKNFTRTSAATPPAPTPGPVRDAAIARIDAEVAALKAGLEQTSKTSLGQFNRTSERLDRIEKAQAEPAAKLAKLSEAVDRLRAAPPPAPAPAAAKETADSGAPPAPAQGQPKDAAPGAPKTEKTEKTDAGRLPTVDGWVLREVGHGAALIESRQGLYEVYAGDTVPGLGHVEVIRRQDGHWVVVTSKGLIVQR